MLDARAIFLGCEFPIVKLYYEVVRWQLTERDRMWDMHVMERM